MKEVRFYEEAEDELLQFAVILSRTGDQFVFCKHRDRDTWEIPGGHREPGETILETAKRELYEETGDSVKQSTLLFMTIKASRSVDSIVGNVCTRKAN